MTKTFLSTWLCGLHSAKHSLRKSSGQFRSVSCSHKSFYSVDGNFNAALLKTGAQILRAEDAAQLNLVPEEAASLFWAVINHTCDETTVWATAFAVRLFAFQSADAALLCVRKLQTELIAVLGATDDVR